MGSDFGDECGRTPPVFSQDGASRDTINNPTGPGLEVFVVFTDAFGTLAALQLADGLAKELEGHLRLLVPYEVPYALPLTKPAVSVEFLECQVRNLIQSLRLNVAAEVCLCRDKRRTLESLLRPQSLVVVGGKQRWWPTSAQKLAQDLQKDGHRVIFAKLR
jgi:hypothetical protein